LLSIGKMADQEKSLGNQAHIVERKMVSMRGNAGWRSAAWSIFTGNVGTLMQLHDNTT
jgi:hypothetical protein